MGKAEDDYDFFQKDADDEINTVIDAKTDFPLFPLGFAIILVTVLGITGNVISAFVLTRKKLRSSSYSVLTLALAFVDTIYLLIKLLRYGLFSLFSHFEIFLQYNYVFVPLSSPYMRPLTFITHTASAYLTIWIAFDRYLVISRPHTARHFCTNKMGRIFALIAVAFSIIYNIPRWFEYHAEPTASVLENEEDVRYQMVISDLRKRDDYKKYYIFWSYLVVMFIVPVFALLVFNVLVWKGLKKIEKSELTLTYTQSRDTSFSTMLLGVAIVFVLCNLDYLVLDLLTFFKIEYPVFWSDVGNFLLTVNSAVNFGIYCLCGRKFRDELGALCTHLSCFEGNIATQSDIFTTTGVWIKDIPRRDKRNNAHLRDPQ